MYTLANNFSSIRRTHYSGQFLYLLSTLLAPLPNSSFLFLSLFFRIIFLILISQFSFSVYLLSLYSGFRSAYNYFCHPDYDEGSYCDGSRWVNPVYHKRSSGIFNDIIKGKRISDTYCFYFYYVNTHNLSPE